MYKEQASLNTELLSLYSSKWNQLCSAMQTVLDDETLEVKPACPLLLSINDEESFKDADIRLMVYGQETNRWYEKFHNDKQTILGRYDEFFNGNECWAYGGQFWNGVKRFISLLQKQYPDKTIRLVWNNIVKIGKDDSMGFPPDYIYEIEREYFRVIEDELKIIQPNVVLFLTGPNYDGVITDNFGDLTSEALPAFSRRQAAKLDLPGVEFAFRTYHPNYLWRNGINNYFKRIIVEIKL